MRNFVTAILLSAGLQTIGTSVSAQEPAVKLSVNYNQDKSTDLNYVKTDPGTFTVIVNFNSLTNSLAASRQVVEVKGVSGKLLTLKPSDSNQPVRFSYGYGYLRGKLNPRYNPEYRYLLPYSSGTKVRVAEAGYVAAKYFGSTTPEDWKAYNFYTADQDTVLAMRKGVVVEVNDSYETDKPSDAVFTSSINQIIVEHTDGTLCRYRGFKKGILVKEGQTVLPGTPLGLNTKFSARSRDFNIAVHFYYLKSDDIESNKAAGLKDSKSMYGSITPHFFTADANDTVLKDKELYTVAFNTEIQQMEMSKKELKSLKK